MRISRFLFLASQVTARIRILDHSGLSSHLWFINRLLIFKLNRFPFQLLKNSLKTNHNKYLCKKLRSFKRFPFFIGKRTDMRVRYLESFNHTVSEAEELKIRENTAFQLSSSNLKFCFVLITFMCCEIGKMNLEVIEFYWRDKTLLENNVRLYNIWIIKCTLEYRSEVGISHGWNLLLFCS